MNPHRVTTEAEFNQELRDAGYTHTERTTTTGRFWRSPTGKHLLVPQAYDGMYPNAIADPVRARLGLLKRDPLA